MDLIHKLFIRIIVPYVMAMSLFFFWPFYQTFKYVYARRRHEPSENVAGKVVLITGASSGIGEHLAYEYAKRGALLVLAARRKNRLREVADNARKLGAADVLAIRGDVTKIEDCQRFVDKTVARFGRLDHLVNSAGITPLSMLGDYTQISDFPHVMETNFWGSVYSTHFAIPHLKKSKGKIIVIASIAGKLPIPRLSLYSASKAALISLYETLRTEFGEHIGITVVTPGLLRSETVQEEFLSKLGVDEGQMKFAPLESAERCAEAIFKGACRGERLLAEPSWMRAGHLWKEFCPEMVEWYNRMQFITKPANVDVPATSTLNEILGDKLKLKLRTASKAD